MFWWWNHYVQWIGTQLPCFFFLLFFFRFFSLSPIFWRNNRLPYSKPFVEPFWYHEYASALLTVGSRPKITLLDVMTTFGAFIYWWTGYFFIKKMIIIQELVSLRKKKYFLYTECGYFITITHNLHMEKMTQCTLYIALYRCFIYTFNIQYIWVHGWWRSTFNIESLKMTLSMNKINSHIL